MLNAFRNKRSNILVWVLMVMLVVGLAGFGIGVSGGLGNQDVAQVGDRSVTAEQYGRALDQELRSISSQLGRNLPMSEARQYGIDRMVLGRLVNDATLDAEASRLGLSMGDETVREVVGGFAPRVSGVWGLLLCQAHRVRNASLRTLLASSSRRIVGGSG